MWLLLLKYRKDVLYVCVILGLIAGFLIYRHSLIVKGEDLVRATDAAAVTRQKAIDDKALNDAHEAHTRELQALKTDVAVDPLPPISLCVAEHSVPKAGVSGSGSSSAGGIQKVPTGDPTVRPRTGPDLSGLLDLLAQRADRLSADSRELNSAIHP